jgi:uncharacterized membrane protein HdeD (DUF308 family)
MTAQPMELPPPAKLNRGRWVLLVSGLLALVAGAAAIVLPAAASIAIDLLVGWVLIVGGVLLAIDAFSVLSFGRTSLRLLLAVISLAAGVYLLAAPLRGTFTLTVVLVVFFITIGVARIAVAIAERGVPGSGFVALSGAVSLLLGVLIGAELPEAAAWAIGLLVGIDLVFYGVSALAGWWALGRLAKGEG